MGLEWETPDESEGLDSFLPHLNCYQPVRDPSSHRVFKLLNEAVKLGTGPLELCQQGTR